MNSLETEIIYYIYRYLVEISIAIMIIMGIAGMIAFFKSKRLIVGIFFIMIAAVLIFCTYPVFVKVHSNLGLYLANNYIPKNKHKISLVKLVLALEEDLSSDNLSKADYKQIEIFLDDISDYSEKSSIEIKAYIYTKLIMYLMNNPEFMK